MFKQLVSLLILTFLLVSCEFLEATNNKGNRNDRDNTRDKKKDTPPFKAEDMPKFLNSHMFRAQGTIVYKHAKIEEFLRTDNESSLPSTLFPVPTKEAHDMDRLTTGPNTPNKCGIELPEGSTVSIGARIRDCRKKNPDNVKAHSWSGKNNGLAGEGDWELVAHKAGKSVWRDVSTGLIWSPPTAARTWAFASGADVDITDQICNGTNDIANETDFFLGITPEEVAWRLPTRNDFLQADINGARFVLSINPDDNTYWTANYITETKEAWAIQHSTGILFKRTEDQSLDIRCVGNVIK